MKLLEQYEQIVEHFRQRFILKAQLDQNKIGEAELDPENESLSAELLHTAYSITLEELAGVLHCTYRNVKLILKRMQEEQWIIWQPGRGRGNRSRLTLIKDKEELWLEQVQVYLDQDQWEKAAQILSRYKEFPIQSTDFLQRVRSSLSPIKKVTRGKTVQETLRFISYRPLAPLDPALVTRRTELHMVQQIFEGLVRYHEESREVEPHLALAWECNSDYTSWTFQLRKGVCFHLEGELQAEDVVSSFNRLTNRKTDRLTELTSPYRWMYHLIKSVKALSLYTVRFTLERPLPTFPDLLAAPPFFIVKEEGHRLWGTGPFKVKVQDQERLVLEVFSNYFYQRAQLDRIEIYYLNQVDGAQMKEVSREVYFPQEVNFQHFQYPSARKKSWKTVANVDLGCKYVMVNKRKKGGPLQHATARNVILGLIDKRRMVQELGENRYAPAENFLPRKENSSTRKEKSDQCTRSSERIVSVAQMIKEPLHLLTYYGAGNENDVQWIKQQGERYGIPFQLTILPYEKIVDADLGQEVDIILAEQWMNRDPIWTLIALVTQEHSLLHKCLIGTPIYEKIMEDIELLLMVGDAQERWRACLKLEDQLMQEHLFYPLYHWQQTAQFPEHVQGVKLNELGWVDYQRIWFKT